MNNYTIKRIYNFATPYQVRCNDTVISRHSTLEEALAARLERYEGDKAHAIAARLAGYGDPSDPSDGVQYSGTL